MTSIKAIARLNSETGGHFFDANVLAFYDCIIDPYVYGGRFFVTSEQPRDGERRWTIREAHPNGDITIFGEFGQYETSEAAHRVAARHTYSLAQRVRSVG